MDANCKLKELKKKKKIITPKLKETLNEKERSRVTLLLLCVCCAFE